MTKVVAPIVVDDHGALETYPTVASACLDLEAIDVVGGAYEAFDSTGRRLVLVARGNEVLLEVPANSQPEPAELERRLRNYIQRVGAARVGITSLDDAPLAVMLHQLIRFDRGDFRKPGK